MSRELMKPELAAAAHRHANGRVSVYVNRDQVTAASVPMPDMPLTQVVLLMSPKAALDLWQALTQLIDGDAELRVAAGREDPEAALFTQTNGLEAPNA